MKNLVWATTCLAASLFSMLSCAEFPDRKITTNDRPDFIWLTDSIPTGNAYKNSESKIVEIKGTITRILNKGGTPTIRINDKILCAFDSDYIEKLKLYSIGQTVLIRGVVQFVPNPKEFDAYLSPAIIVDESKGSQK